MSFSTSAFFLPRQFGLLLAALLQKPGLPFADVLPAEVISAAFEEEGAIFAQDDDAVYTPAVTLWAFLGQVFFKGEQRSCAAAVSRVIVLFVSLGRKPPSDDTGVYCRARAKLSERALARLVYHVADGCESKIPDHWRWKNRRTHLVDGFTVSMPDTRENQAAYPQPNSQKKGVGFPLARAVVMLSLATAMASGLALGPYSGKETGETALFRQLLDRLSTGDVVLADRYYCSYFMICLLQQRGVDLVSRLHHKRAADFRRGQRLGPGDHVVEWPRPERPDWMDEAIYEQMPASIRIREVEVAVPQPGFRPNVFVVATTLLDAREHTRDDLAELYHQRWLAELDIRAIKSNLGMDISRCKSPEMVRNEIWTCLLAYNLVRQTMLQSALAFDRSPRQLSFTAAMQKVAASWQQGPLLEAAVAAVLVEIHWKQIAGQRVGHRPDRIEPRAVKRRPKPHPLLMKPRDEARAACLAANLAGKA